MKNLHLIISSLLIIPVALAYGTAPNKLLPLLFNFNAATTTDIHNIFRAMTGLYLAMAVTWIAGIFKTKYWATATIINIVFMSGLAFGRLTSFAADGMPSRILVIGFIAECLLAMLAYFNWKKYKETVS